MWKSEALDASEGDVLCQRASSRLISSGAGSETLSEVPDGCAFQLRRS